MASEPAERLTMADVAFQLHQITEQQGVTGTQERAALLASPAPVEPEPDPVPTVAEEPSTPLTPAPMPEADNTQHRRRWPLVLFVVAAAALVAIGAWAFLGDDPGEQEPTASDERSSDASPRGTANSPDAGTTSAPQESSPSEDPSVSTDSAEQFVTDYYALLPDDTDSAWALLSPEMQADIGGVEDYEAFWNTVASVQVDDTTSPEANAVDVTLTYVTDAGSEQETRRIEVAEQGDGFVIVGDEVVS
jgi:eukaryotic-like serine/threonine-protein kinase